MVFEIFTVSAASVRKDFQEGWEGLTNWLEAGAGGRALPPYRVKAAFGVDLRHDVTLTVKVQKQQNTGEWADIEEHRFHNANYLGMVLGRDSYETCRLLLGRSFNLTWASNGMTHPPVLYHARGKAARDLLGSWISEAILADGRRAALSGNKPVSRP